MKSTTAVPQSQEGPATLSTHPALDPELMDRQPTLNLMTIGHVAHGKSTLMRALSLKDTMGHSDEKKRNMTIKLGYTSFKVFRCRGTCRRPECYHPFPSETPKDPPCPGCGAPCQLVRHFSFVDCPGHAQMMKTMLTGASVVDGAILVVSAKDTCPAPRTAEHWAAAAMLGLTGSVVVAQNKVDLVTPSRCAQSLEEIVAFMKAYRAPETNGKNGHAMRQPPVIPVCAQRAIGIDALCMALVDRIPLPPAERFGHKDECKVAARLSVIRSFDVNRAGTKPKKLKGGVAGGTLLQGRLKIGDEVELRPGLNLPGNRIAAVRSRVVSVGCGKAKLKVAKPGCNIGVGLTIDPFMTKGDRLVGQVIGHPGTLPPVYRHFVVTYVLMRRVLGGEKMQRVQALSRGENIHINVGSYSGEAKVVEVGVRIRHSGNERGVHVEVRGMPVCAPVGARVAISRRVESRDAGASWRLVGGGVVRMVKPLSLVPMDDIPAILDGRK